MAMKILLGIIGFALLFFLIFFSIGFFVKQVSFSTDAVVIDAPIEKTWEVFNDEKNMAKWLVNFDRIEHIKGEYNTVGSEYNLYFQENGKEIVFHEVMTDIVPMKKLGFDMHHDMMDSHTEVNFNDLGGKTEMTSSTVTRGKSIFYRAIMVLAKGSMKQRTEEGYQKLKALIEGS